MAGEVILLGAWPSLFCQRVRIALAEKGVEYEYKEENLADKSALLLNSNPIHKKVPVLIHNRRPICESLIIVQYIDQVWKEHRAPLMPLDPYQQANARFWADFVDKKICDSATRIWKKTGEAREAAKEEFVESLKLIEGELGEKAYFGGENFGFTDITLIPLACWVYTLEMHGTSSVEKECPKLMAWMKRCQGRQSVSKALPDPHKVHEFVGQLKRKFGLE